MNVHQPQPAPEDAAAGLPDTQNGPAELIRGARAAIQQVGVSNFRLPLRIGTRDGGEVTLETAVAGTVSLAADRRGINMSRIMRSFYAHADRRFGFEAMEAVLEAYLRDHGSDTARLELRFRFPMLRPSLRSGLQGWQYYETALEAARDAAGTRRILHLDYVYASTCPCSMALSEHARDTRGQIAAPHAQRSVARVSLALPGYEPLWIEDVVDLCTRALPTETQVMVKREDEQAFAELSGENPVFVEDAVRLLAESLGGDVRIGDFRIAASHQESLHSHDAVAVLTRGGTFAQSSQDPRFLGTLHHPG